MELDKQTAYLQLLDSELVEATGCTEPIAVAYAAALARKQVKDLPIEKIDIIASGNIIKNAMAVTIPGTSEQGVKIAAALGALAGDSDKGLLVLEQIGAKDLQTAKQLCRKSVSLTTSQDLPLLHVEVTVRAGGHSGRAVLENQHDCLVLLEKDGQILWDGQTGKGGVKKDIPAEDIEGILDFVNVVELGKLHRIEQSIQLNTKICREGLKNNYGLTVGRTLMDNNAEAAMMAYAAALTSAGSDARMGGAALPVMSNSGSGNQGICATMPVVACAAKLSVSREKLLRAVTLSNLMTIHVKRSFGRLSPLCGAVAAGIGASCGIAYVLGGGLEQVKGTIQNMLGNVTGMICDGAKAGCAMKVSTCVFAAVQSALLVMSQKEIQPSEGIIECDVEATLNNLSRLSTEGMPKMDPLLLSIMVKKQSEKE